MRHSLDHVRDALSRAQEAVAKARASQEALDALLDERGRVMAQQQEELDALRAKLFGISEPLDPHACPVSGEDCICDDAGRASCHERVSDAPVSDQDTMRATIAQLVRLIEDADRAQPGWMPVARAAIAARRAKRRWLDAKDGPR